MSFTFPVDDVRPATEPLPARRFGDVSLVVALAVVAMLLLGCRPFDAATSSADDDEGGDDGGGGTVLDAGSDAPAHTETPPSSCKDLLQAAPGLRGADGIYEIDPDGPGGSAPIQVFCDLSLDDGGWTLVGRSAETTGQQPPFGWTSATGDVRDEGRPYSLDVAGAKLAFTEVLVADQARAIAYKLLVPADFLTRYSASAGPVERLTKVRGDCQVNAPSMLGNVGATSANDGFFFRDNKDLAIRTGLKPDGFDLYYGDDCRLTARLDDKQGVIFVR